MHRGHDEPYNPYAVRTAGGHAHAHAEAHAHSHSHSHAHGHNRGTVQWQTPHDPHGGDVHEHAPHEPDLDLVETAFVEGFRHTGDPTSFLRLAGIPFVGRRADGAELKLLRVALGTSADMASLTPHLGGGSFRYDPLPAAMVSKRSSLAFVYFDGWATMELTFEEARALSPV
ncbi:hypothetical protein [Acuticoccus sediminis]|uniref:hypothetical protein n=1 Tax=Acuticoccus sediminis TaxID=2184697 RepID=UPI001CFE2050|nr:hypothetical protein [Acuticoccus sediminis]